MMCTLHCSAVLIYSTSTGYVDFILFVVPHIIYITLFVFDKINVCIMFACVSCCCDVCLLCSNKGLMFTTFCFAEYARKVKYILHPRYSCEFGIQRRLFPWPKATEMRRIIT